MEPPTHTPPRLRRGFLNPHVVVAFSFWTTMICIVVAVTASILAIWEFTGTDVLLRTVATCAVIVGGTSAFTVVNWMFAEGGE
jgi:NO-binding membrane sensor protein with MHYT domain